MATAVRSLITLFVAVLFAPPLYAGAYYVNCSSGSNSNTGTSPASAWATIAKASATVNGDDVVTISGGPCVGGNIGFNRSALSGSGGCSTTSDSGCTVFRGDSSSAYVSIRPASAGQNGFLISGGVDSIKFENLVFETNSGIVFDESIRVFNGGNTNLVFRNINVQGVHNGGSVRLLNNSSTPSSNLLLDNVKVVGTLGNGFVVQPTLTGSITDVTFNRCFAISNKQLVSGSPVCGGEVDGFSLTHAKPFNWRMYGISFLGGQSTNNGEDGYDVFDSFNDANQASHTSLLLNPWATGNCSAGIRGSRSMHIENAYVAANGGPGIRVGAPSSDTDNSVFDTTIAKLNIVSSTFSNNTNTQISLDGRTKQLDARIYNTIAASATDPSYKALTYDKSGPNVSLSWDYSHLYRAGPDTAANAVVQFYNPAGTCTHTAIHTCDSSFSGTHNNSINSQTSPQFGTDGYHLTTSSPGWQTGKMPSTISGLSGVTIFVADNVDNVGTARSSTVPEMGAFEGEGGGC